MRVLHPLRVRHCEVVAQKRWLANLLRDSQVIRDGVSVLAQALTGRLDDHAVTYPRTISLPTLSSSFVLFCFVLFCFVLFCFVLFCFVLFCFVLFCFVLFCFVLFCFVLFCFVLFCFVLFCFVLFCFVVNSL